MKKYLIGLLILCFNNTVFSKTRIKNMAQIKGLKNNSLMGYGLVIGLSKTGDSKASSLTMKTAATWIQNMGIKIGEQELVPGSFAMVICTAELKPFSQIGDRIDVRVSATQDATSLAGGTLLMTPLSAGDGKVYAMAQGPIVTGSADGVGTKTLTVVNMSAGAMIEREFIAPLFDEEDIFLNLKEPDFTNVERMSLAINAHFKGFYAEPVHPSSLKVRIPDDFQSKKMAFIAELEDLEIDADQKAIVVINEKTATIIMGGDVRINPITLSHGALSLTVEGKTLGKTLVGVPVNEFVETLNNMGVTPKDMIDIIRTIHKAGALQAELEFI